MGEAADSAEMRTEVAQLLRVCAEEAAFISAMFSLVEKRILDWASTARSDGNAGQLAEALQGIDHAAQHLTNFRDLLQHASSAATEAGEIAVGPALRAVNLEAMARRLANAMTFELGVAQESASGDVELL